MNSPYLMLQSPIYVTFKRENRQFSVAMLRCKNNVGVNVWCLNCLLSLFLSDSGHQVLFLTCTAAKIQKYTTVATGHLI